MTVMLERAIAEVVKLPETKQDKLASRLLEELAIEQWAEEQEESLEVLVARARDQIARGEVYPLESIL